MNEPERSFSSTALYVTGGLLIWIANFVFVYSFAAVACARGFARLELAGVGIVPLVATLASAVGAVTTAILLRRSILRRPQSNDDHSRFTRFTSTATCAIALVGFVFVVLPVFFVPGCGR